MKKALCLTFCTLLTACASTAGNEFTLDTKGVDMSRYPSDLLECKQLAERKSVATDAATGAVAGAVLGAAIGAAVGDNSDWSTGGAKWGLISGGASGAWDGYQEKRGIARNCLRGRGYKVLD